MSAPNVDVVLVIDASSSMRPCIEQLRKHLRELVKPMQGYVGRVRFGLVALGASSKDDGSVTYKVRTLAGEWDLKANLYNQGGRQLHYFSDDSDVIIRAMDQIVVSGDENNLLALDIALDHPFGPTSTTKRVIAMFADEILENGVERRSGLAKLPELIDKIHRRRVKLFCALPYSDAAQRLSEANGSELEAVEGREGLMALDFRALLGQMGKSISVSALQGALVEEPTAALFGQDEWISGDGAWNGSDT